MLSIIEDITYYYVYQYIMYIDKMLIYVLFLIVVSIYN